MGKKRQHVPIRVKSTGRIIDPRTRKLMADNERARNNKRRKELEKEYTEWFFERHRGTWTCLNLMPSLEELEKWKLEQEKESD